MQQKQWYYLNSTYKATDLIGCQWRKSKRYKRQRQSKPPQARTDNIQKKSMYIGRSHMQSHLNNQTDHQTERDGALHYPPCTKKKKSNILIIRQRKKEPCIIPPDQLKPETATVSQLTLESQGQKENNHQTDSGAHHTPPATSTAACSLAVFTSRLGTLQSVRRRDRLDKAYAYDGQE